MRFFDTHTHVNFAAFKDDGEQVIKRALSGDTWMINVGTQTDTSRSAVDLAKKYPEGVFAAIGLHPVHTYMQMLDEEESHFRSRAESFDDSIYEQMLTDKVVAVGEIGLDYFRLPAEGQKTVISKQREEFVKQLHFAKKQGLPVIIHCRDAYDDLIEILKSEYPGGRGVAHSFTDTWETAKKFLDIGFYVALNGILTFAAQTVSGRASPNKVGRDKAENLLEAARNLPIDRILTETDAPYLTPPPYRGKRNEPSYVRYITQKIAEIKKMDTAEVAEQTFSNACELFGVKKQ